MGLVRADTSIIRCTVFGCSSIGGSPLSSCLTVGCYLPRWALKEKGKSTLLLYCISRLIPDGSKTDLSPPRINRRRNDALQKGNESLAGDNKSLARDAYVKAVDVTPEMAYQLIKVRLSSAGRRKKHF